MERIRKRFSFTLNPKVVEQFKEHCNKENISMSRSVEDFMLDALQSDTIKDKVEEITNIEYNSSDSYDMVHDLLNLLNYANEQIYDLKQKLQDSKNDPNFYDMYE